MAKIPNSFSIFSSNFFIPEETIDRNSTLFQKECIGRIQESRSLRFQRNAERKRLEGRFERKDRARSPFEDDLNRSAGLNGNCTTPSSCEFGRKCAFMHHLCLDAPSDW